MRRPTLLLAALFGACAPPPGGGVAIRSAGPHRLTNPLLDVESPAEYRELGPLRRRLEEVVAEKTARGDVAHVSIYFRDLNNGPWLGINQSERFSPASLFKVPIMLTLFKQAEADPRLLSLRLADSRAEEERPVAVPPSHGVVAGRSYSVAELIDLMITTSDNKAHSLLLDVLDRGVFKAMFEELGLTPPELGAPDATMRVKEYASFFRVLYNASFLNQEMSERALGILSRVEFADGLVAGVPSGTPVAHKFGERTLAPDALIQLHDCGIVYRPRRPYILCVMTRGKAIGPLKSAVGELSRVVYDAQPRD